MCKADSQSTLSILDPHDMADIKSTLDEDRIKSIIRVLRKKIGLLLAGFDVVIDNLTGNHAVIDINVFPSYDNFPHFFEHLLESINEMCLSGISNGMYKFGDYNVNNCHSSNHIFNGLVNIGNDSEVFDVKGMNIN